MSKYNLLWEHIKTKEEQSFRFSFEEIEKISGVAIDHSFLTYKKELLKYGYEVKKISLKEKSILFHKIE